MNKTPNQFYRNQWIVWRNYANMITQRPDYRFDSKTVTNLLARLEFIRQQCCHFNYMAWKDAK